MSISKNVSQDKRPKLALFTLTLILLICFFSAVAQNTIYTPLYTSGNFVKTIDFTKPVGEIAGSASATASGGITYSIPIFTSPGTNGVKPSVSLTYNSQASSGIAGYGWNISGLSAISRTGKNIYHNGIVSPVTYTAANDAFLLDGMRLNPISGVNGGNGTIYAGETESFAKIISYEGNFPDNPGWFQVTGKDGSVIEFGTTVGSLVLGESPNTVMMWRMSKIIDVNGNYIEFKYDNSNRDSRIQQILYTGNWNTGLVPYNQVNFAYSIRDDQNTIYESGNSLSTKYLLDKITVVHTNDVNINETVKTYKLNYGFDNVNSMLKEVEEFGGDENSPSLNSTIFLYGDPGGDIFTETTAQFNGECITGDFNADGKTDILANTYYYDQGIKFSSGYKIFLDPQSTIPLYEKTLTPGHLVVENKKIVNFFAADYNRDGRDDVVHVKTKFVTYPSGYTEWQAERFTIEFTTTTGSWTQEMPMPVDRIIHPSGNFFIPGDFDGDGNQDYITILKSSGGNFRGFLCPPGKIFANYGIWQFTVTPGEWSANSIAAADKILPFDLNGDGKQEVLVIHGTQTSILSINPYDANTYMASVILTTTEIAVGDRLFPGDFNGDRKSDLLIRKTNGQWKILYSTGTNFTSNLFYFNQPVLMNGNYSDDKIVIGDFNGDGKSDIAHGFSVWVNGTSNSSKFSLYYSKGLSSSSFFYEQYTYNNVLPYVDVATGDFNGDGRTDILAKSYYFGAPDIIYFKPYNQERLLQKITTGHNITTNFEYKALTDKRVYPVVYNRTISLDDPINQNPFNYVELPMYVLSTLTYPDGTGGNNITYYNYENAVLHRAAKGFLGFKKIIIQNNVTDTRSVTENEINTQFAAPYTVRQTTNLYSTNQQLSESLITYSFQNLSTGNHDIRYLQKIDKTLSIDYLNDKASESANTYDSYGNITNNTNKVGILSGNTVTPTETTVSSSAYSIHNTPVPAKPDYITVTKTRVGMPAISATTTFTYNAKGLRASETGFSGLPKAVTTNYTYNNFGNPVTVTVSSAGLNNRTANSTYDPKGRYVITAQKTGSGLSHTESFTINSKWGLPLSHTSTDCLTTTYDYDAFGALVNTVLPDGNNVTINNVWHTINIFGSPNPDKLFYTYTHYTGGKPDSKIYINKFGQEWRQETASMYGTAARWHTISTTYDNRGNIKTKTNLHFPNGPIEDPNPPYTQPVETPRITTYNYDVYNRISTLVNDIGSVDYTYTQIGNGKIHVNVTNLASQSSSQIIDAIGKVVSSIDNGGQLDFVYDSRGNQKEVNQSGSILISSVYDEYGRQTSLTDINAGTTVYSYDAYGQLRQQTDAKGNTHNMNYDDFGRIINRTGPEGTTTYEYYQHLSFCGNNKPTRITGFNGVIKEYTYDGLRRLASEIQTIDGTTYTTTYAYNGFSQLAQTTYPSGLPVFQTYDAGGYLTKVYHSSTLPKNSLFANGWVDGEGKYLTYDLGFTKTTTKTYNKDFPATTITPGVQNLTYNFEQTTGNLLQRTDNIKNQTEYFSFDNLNRLNTTTPNSTQQLGITYDANGTISMGNIVTKTDAGYYKYRNDKIHAVAYTMNQPVPGQSPVFPAPVSATPLTEQLITYTPFLKTASISENNYLLNLTYGPDYERVKTELSQLGNIEETRYFLGNYEKQIVNGIITNTREIHYISGGNGICAIIIKEDGIVQPSYIVYTDHLGSITTVTDQGGNNIIAEQNFDAWGRRRDPNNWNTVYPANSILTVPGWLYRGYTGHEALPHFSLINMNGRMYDPVLGRMLSPDSYVQESLYSQNYNRYSYCWNNPLKYTDPSGNFLQAAFFAVSFLGEFISNLTNGTSDALGKAYHSAKNATNEFGGAFRVTYYERPGSSYSYGINPFSLSVSHDAVFKEGDWTISMSGGIGAFNGVFISLGIGYSDRNFAFNVSGSASSYSATGNGGGLRLGGGVTLFDRANNQSFSAGLTAFGGSDAQNNWYIGYSKGDFSFRMTNDAGVGGDKYRTAAAEIGIGETSFGFNLYTTQPPTLEHKRGFGLGENFKSMWGGNKNGTYSTGSRVYAGLYFGYQSNNTISRIGIDAPWVQDFFQNGIHKHLTNGPYFNINYGPSTRLFLQTSNYFPYSLY